MPIIIYSLSAPLSGMWTLSSTVKQTSALRLAASRGHTGCVEELLFRGAEVNADPGGHTALHDACVGGHDACVQLLLSHGAEPDLLLSLLVLIVNKQKTFSFYFLCVQKLQVSSREVADSEQLSTLYSFSSSIYVEERKCPENI